MLGNVKSTSDSKVDFLALMIYFFVDYSLAKMFLILTPTKAIFIKFICINQGPTCQIRNIQLNTKSYIK